MPPPCSRWANNLRQPRKNTHRAHIHTKNARMRAKCVLNACNERLKTTAKIKIFLLSADDRKTLLKIHAKICGKILDKIKISVIIIVQIVCIGG